MRVNAHPEYLPTTITCACGSVVKTRSARLEPSFTVDVCNACHPFYTGKQKMLDIAGRVEKFRNKYKNLEKPAEKPAKA